MSAKSPLERIQWFGALQADRNVIPVIAKRYFKWLLIHSRCHGWIGNRTVERVFRWLDLREL